MNGGKSVLVTGGAGYIGSHVARLLVEEGYDVTVIDLLREKGGVGNSWAVPARARFVQGDIGDRELLDTLPRFDAILHFAAFILVDESVREPEKYFLNNAVGSRTLFQYAVDTGVSSIIFSSTCATYGEVKVDAISETHPQNPINPYGQSKLEAEKSLKELCQQSSIGGARGTKFIALRYFNPAGAHSSLEIGQARPEATHLVNVAAEAAVGRRKKVMVFGDDYPTPDGTCLRDYIHIQDLADAHLSALRYLEKGGDSDFFNVGYGRPYSVREVLTTMKEVSGVDFAVETVGRRSGDPARLAADPSKIQFTLGWKPRYNSLRAICESHYLWEKKRSE
ncbi:MAG: UDP-glucose 4-epimerase GalE [Bdellovibrionales bacterium]|jgi:UDP-glucose 4-epimerase|nr:UDP-glucose 4-epimerase GalE [Bdellovibrionales bacterium]